MYASSAGLGVLVLGHIGLVNDKLDQQQLSDCQLSMETATFVSPIYQRTMAITANINTTLLIVYTTKTLHSAKDAWFCYVQVREDLISHPQGKHADPNTFLLFYSCLPKTP